MSLSYGLAVDHEGHFLTLAPTEPPPPALTENKDEWMLIPGGIRREVLVQVCHILEKRPAREQGDIDPEQVLPRGRLPQTILELRFLIAHVEALV